MITRSSTIQERSPLTEDVFTLNKLPLARSEKRLTSPSRDRHGERSLAAPSRKLTQYSLSPSKEITRSPSKRNLGSPIRLARPTTVASSARRNAVIPSDDAEDPINLLSAPQNLHSPVRKIKPENKNENMTSPLKKPPTRLLARLQPVQNLAVVIHTPPKPKRHHSRSPKTSPTKVSSIRTDQSPEASTTSESSFTPIRVPLSPTTASSPPHEDLFDDEADLWQPSIPLKLTNSLSRLAISDAPAPTIFIDIKATPSANPELATIATSLGAKTVQRWNWNPDTQGTPSKPSKVVVTHVIYLNGSTRTLKKIIAARKLGVQVECTGLAWLRQSQAQGHFIPTDGFAINVDEELTRLVGKIDIPLIPLISPERQFKRVVPETPKAKYTPSALERQNIIHARRESIKFKPPISSPLAKACT